MYWPAALPFAKRGRRQPIHGGDFHPLPPPTFSVHFDPSTPSRSYSLPPSLSVSPAIPSRFDCFEFLVRPDSYRSQHTLGYRRVIKLWSKGTDSTTSWRVVTSSVCLGLTGAIELSGVWRDSRKPSKVMDNKPRALMRRLQITWFTTIINPA